MEVIEKLSILLFILFVITAIIFKVFDRDEKEKDIHRYIFLASLSFLVFSPNMHAIQKGQFTTVAIYSMGTWFVLELLSLITRIIPIVQELRDALARSKDLKRSLDKVSISVSEQTEENIEALEKLYNNIQNYDQDKINELENDLDSLHQVIINTYSNLCAYKADNQILNDFENQVLNQGLIMIKSTDIPFDSEQHISAGKFIDTTDKSKNKKVAEVLRIGLKKADGTIISSANISRYRYVSNS